MLPASVVAMLAPALTLAANPTAGTVLTGTNTINGGGATINGNDGTGYFVSSGTLTINNATLSGFSTTGGTGSGGGAGLGGAIFVNSGATVVLNNVNFTGNNVTGGQGGVGDVGGSLNNMFNAGTVVAQATSGSTPQQFPYIDVDGTTGTKGYDGAYNASGIGAAGGHGGAGGDGSNDATPMILGITSATAALAAASAELAGALGSPFTLNIAATKVLPVVNAGIDLGDAIAELAYFDQALASGQIGGGGDGGSGGTGGTGGFGYGGGVGGDGGEGGTGASSRFASAWKGGAAGGDAGDGGDGGVGGFGAGGGKGGNGGLGGGGAGFEASEGQPEQAAVYETITVPAVYSIGYYLDPSDTSSWVTVQDSLAEDADAVVNFAGGLWDHDNDPATPEVTRELKETQARVVQTYLKTPATPAIPSTLAGSRPNGADGAGGEGGRGGFGAGSGSQGNDSDNGYGGEGGDGYGGAIFVRDGGTLHIMGNALFHGNAAAGGSSANGGAAGVDAGADIFMMKTATVILDAGTGNKIVFNGGIADDSKSSLEDASNAAGQGAGLEVRSGLVIFNAANTYSGQTFLTGGVLRADDGHGIHSASNINFRGGVLETSGEFERYTGTAGGRVQWTGSGGFSAYGGELTVTLNNGVQLSWNSGNFVTAGSTLLFGSEFSTDTVTFTNDINLNGQVGRVAVAANADNSNHAILTGVLSNGSLIIGSADHTGVVVLTGANTYTGGTTVNGGTLVLEDDGRLADEGRITIAAIATVDFSRVVGQGVGDLAGAGTLNLGGNELVITQTGDSTFSGVIADGGVDGGEGASVVKVGSGHLTLSGDSTYTGSTEIQEGELTLTGTLATASVDVSAGAVFNNESGGLLDEAELINAGVINLAVDETVASLENTGTINGVGTLTAATYDLGSGSIINAHLGAGELTANGTVALNGTIGAETVLIASGTTTLGSAERLLDTAEVTIDSGANLVLGGAEKIGALLGSGNLNNAGHRLTLGSGEFSGIISGTGGLTKVSGDELELSGPNTYTGSTLIEAGTVKLTGSLESNAVTVSAGATLESSAGGLASHTVLTNHGTIELTHDDTVASFTSTGTLDGDGTLTAATYDLNDGTVINANLGAGVLTTTGDVVLAGNSDALTVNVLADSTLSLAAEEVLNDEADVTVNGTLILSGGNETIRLLNGNGIVNVNSFLLSITEGGTFTGTINALETELIASGGTLDLIGETNTETTTVTNGGEINLDGTLNSGDVKVQDGSLNVFGGTIVTKNIQIDAAGLLSLGGAYSLSYETMSGHGTIDTPLFINIDGSKISGFLTFTGDFINNGIVSPGDSPGMITVTGDYSGTGTVEMELETTTPVTGHDQIRVGGSINLDPASTLVVQGYNNALPARGAVYQIFADLSGASVAVNGTFGSVLFDADGVAGSGAAVANAATVFDVASGNIIATGLNAANSTFADLGANRNQGVVAQAFINAAFVGQNQIDSTTSEGQLALQFINPNGGNTALALYSPDYYGSMASYAIGGDRTLARRVQDRVGVTTDFAGSSKGAVFAGAINNDIESADNVSIDRSDYFAGGDLFVAPGFSLGVVVSKHDGDLRAPLGRGEVDGIGGLLYARYAIDSKLSLYGSLGYSQHDYDLNRSTVSGSVRASTDATAFTGTIGVQHAGWTKGSLSFAPRLGLAYSQASVDGFTETGSVDALTNNGFDATLITGEAGLSSVWSTSLLGRSFKLEFNLGVEQVLADDKDDLDVSLVSTPAIAYPVQFADDASTRVVYSLNAGYSILDNTTIYAGYEGRSGDGHSKYVNFGVRVGF